MARWMDARAHASARTEKQRAISAGFLTFCDRIQFPFFREKCRGTRDRSKAGPPPDQRTRDTGGRCQCAGSTASGAPDRCRGALCAGRTAAGGLRSPGSRHSLRQTRPSWSSSPLTAPGWRTIRLRACLRTRIGSLGPLGYLVANSDSVGSGLMCLQTYLHLHDEGACRSCWLKTGLPSSATRCWSPASRAPIRLHSAQWGNCGEHVARPVRRRIFPAGGDVCFSRTGRSVALSRTLRRAGGASIRFARRWRSTQRFLTPHRRRGRDPS